MKVLNETHALLKAYAVTHYVLTVPGTIDRLISWYADYAGVRISERTFKRHTSALASAGLIHVKHTRMYTRYTLLSEEIEVPRYKFLPTSDPWVFEITENGAEVIRIPEAHEPASSCPDCPWAALAYVHPNELEYGFAGTLPF
jgi:hypothetical protein